MQSPIDTCKAFPNCRIWVSKRVTGYATLRPLQLTQHMIVRYRTEGFSREHGVARTLACIDIAYSIAVASSIPANYF